MASVSFALLGGCTQAVNTGNNPADEFRAGQCVATPPADWSRHGSSGGFFRANADESISGIISALKPLSPLNYSDLLTPPQDTPLIKGNVNLEAGDKYVVNRAIVNGRISWTIYINSKHICSLMVSSRMPVDYTSIVRPILMSLHEE